MQDPFRDLPYLDLAKPGFSTRGPEMRDARDCHWAARTPFGLAVLRHEVAGQLLRDRRLRQGSYAWPETIGLKGSFAQFWTRSVIGQEGDRHKAQRRIVQTGLAPDWIESLRPRFSQIAQDLLPDRECEFMTSFARPFAGQAICTLFGLPLSDYEEIARDATILGRGMALDGKSHEADVNAAHDRLADLAVDLINHARKGGDAGCVNKMCAVSDVSDAILIDLIVIMIFGGVDTTQAQLGLAMALLASYPEQWSLLHRRPEMVPQALEECLRHRPTTTWATREATEMIVVNSLSIPQGTTVHILVHGTATDPNVHDGAFDVARPAQMHFGFGGGAHHCLGHFVARTDMAEALRVLVHQFAIVSLNGTAQFLPETGNTGPVKLPLRFGSE